jgi:signal transduction histidine kinase
VVSQEDDPVATIAADLWTCEGEARTVHPAATATADEASLRAALTAETADRRRAECLAKIQSGAVQLALDLLVREPDIEGFFGTFIKTLVEECESHGCGVWLIDPDHQGAHLWMAYFQNRLFNAASPDWERLALPRISMADHLFAYRPGWAATTEFTGQDARLPESVRDFNREIGGQSLTVAPMVLGAQTLGWVVLSTGATPYCEGEWRTALLEAIARQATLLLHQSQMAERSRLEERRKVILEERNRLARDIHDTLAQGFAAILMQLQGAQREARGLPPRVASKLETAIDLARSHIIEARRSVCALRPQVGDGEDLPAALKRLTDLARRTSDVPIALDVEDLPRYGDAIEREIVGIAKEALNNAVRHSRARQITLRASAARSIGFRLSVADDGRGIARERRSSGFGITSMQERAARIGASLTIVTAPRSGTEVVVAWEPMATLPHAHVVS